MIECNAYRRLLALNFMFRKRSWNHLTRQRKFRFQTVMMEKKQPQVKKISIWKVKSCIKDISVPLLMIKKATSTNYENHRRLTSLNIAKLKWPQAWQMTMFDLFCRATFVRRRNKTKESQWPWSLQERKPFAKLRRKLMLSFWNSKNWWKRKRAVVKKILVLWLSETRNEILYSLGSLRNSLLKLLESLKPSKSNKKSLTRSSFLKWTKFQMIQISLNWFKWEITCKLKNQP